LLPSASVAPSILRYGLGRLCEKQVFGSEHQREGHPKAAETFFRARSRARDKSSSQI